MILTIGDLTYGELLDSLRKDLLLDARTDVLPGSILASLIDQNGAAAFLQLLTSGKARMDRGSVTVTWGGVSKFSNTATVTHGLGVAPAEIIVTGDWTSVTAVAGTISPTTTTFQVTAQSTDTATPASGITSKLSWIAIG